MKLESALIIFGIIIFLIVGFGVLLVFLLGDFGMVSTGDKIAVISLRGELVYDYGDAVGATDVRTLRALFKTANEDDSVVAIVLDVDSPGGSVVASREMMRIVKSSQKPVVAWIGDVCASGAYYVASAADEIVVDQDSFVGSIGVISTTISYEELLKSLGINVTVIKSGEYKDIGSSYREVTPSERDRLQQVVDVIQEHFIQDIATNRNIEISRVREISNGLLYLGIEAKALNLADLIGGFEDAVNSARQLSNSPEAEVIYLDSYPSVQEAIFTSAYSAGGVSGGSLTELGEEDLVKVINNG